jgi:hypothetical protein
LYILANLARASRRWCQLSSNVRRHTHHLAVSPLQIESLERALGFALPPGYCEALSEHGLSGDWTDHPEFITDVDALLAENKHFKMIPEDLSDIRSPGLMGSLKFWLIYGSGRRLVEFRRKLHKTWVQGRRFIVGNDLGEEQYFIVLDDPDLKVHRYELESRHSKVVAISLPKWLAEVKRRQAEAESDA